MPGIRLHHPTLRSCVYVVEDYLTPYTVPYLCGTCKETHQNKALHISLDPEGYTILAEPVYERLRRCGMAGMVVDNEVANPPPTTLGAEAAVLSEEQAASIAIQHRTMRAEPVYVPLNGKAIAFSVDDAGIAILPRDTWLELKDHGGYGFDVIGVVPPLTGMRIKVVKYAGRAPEQRVTRSDGRS